VTPSLNERWSTRGINALPAPRSVALPDYKGWSLHGATGGNRSQIQRPQEPQKYAKTVAMRCDQLPIGAHGKEGFDGSSPSEGFAV